YAKKVRKVKDELDELWRTEPASWTTDPVKWWAERRATYPRASRMAHDIFSIPGSAVAVERIFSGGRDTISLRRARLSADTIRALMISKQWIR
ncbi:HAT dimerization, partial [Exidia glandulosa HHB12029]